MKIDGTRYSTLMSSDSTARKPSNGRSSSHRGFTRRALASSSAHGLVIVGLVLHVWGAGRPTPQHTTSCVFLVASSHQNEVLLSDGVRTHAIDAVERDHIDAVDRDRHVGAEIRDHHPGRKVGGRGDVEVRDVE